MIIENWLAFVAASMSILAMPGPIAVLIISCTLKYGRKAALLIIAGVIFGDITVMLTSLLGVGLILVNTPFVFQGLKIAGALVLLGMGLKYLFEKKDAEFTATPAKIKNRSALWLSGFTLAVLHPGGFVFFTAFAPQFINMSQSYMLQAVVMLVTFLILTLVTSLFWMLMTYRLYRVLGTGNILARFQRGSGVVLICVSLIAMGYIIAP